MFSRRGRIFLPRVLARASSPVRSQVIGFLTCGMLAGRTWEMLKELKPAPVSKAERTRLGGAPGSEWEPHSAYIGWENGPGEVFEIKNVKRGGELVAQPTKLVQKVWKNPSTLDCFEELHSNRVYVAVMR